MSTKSEKSRTKKRAVFLAQKLGVDLEELIHEFYVSFIEENLDSVFAALEQQEQNKQREELGEKS